MRRCPICKVSMRLDREFYSCTCGCRVHASHFDSEDSEQRLAYSKEAAAAMVRDRVFLALAFLDDLADDGRIVDSSIRRKIAEQAAATVADHWADALPDTGEAIHLEDCPF